MNAPVTLADRLVAEAESWELQICPGAAHPEAITRNGHATRRAILLREAAELARKVSTAPIAIMDTRDALGICAPAEDDFPTLHALQGKRVALVEVPNG